MALKKQKVEQIVLTGAPYGSSKSPSCEVKFIVNGSFVEAHGDEADEYCSHLEFSKKALIDYLTDIGVYNRSELKIVNPEGKEVGTLNDLGLDAALPFVEADTSSGYTYYIWTTSEPPKGKAKPRITFNVSDSEPYQGYGGDYEFIFYKEDVEALIKELND